MSTSQKQITIYSQAADGYIGSGGASYSTARAGSGLWVATNGIHGTCGQNKVGSTSYCYLVYVMFDCSEIPVDVVSIDDVQPSVAVEKVFTHPATLQLRAASWTPPLTTGAWIAGASIGSQTLLASLASSSMSESAYDEWTAETGIEDWIVPGGICYGVICSDNFVNGTAPTAAEYANVYLGDGDSLRMKLVVTYTSEDVPKTRSRSLVVRPFSTRAAAAESIARQDEGIIDWWIDGTTARAEMRPSSVAEIPRSRLLIISRDTPGVSVSVASETETTPDVLAMVYRAFGVAGVRDGTIRRTVYPAERTAAMQRSMVIDATNAYMSDGEAAEYLANLYDRYAAETLKATITVTGGLWTVDHQWRPAPLIRPGDWVDIVSEFGHAPVMITGTSYDPATQSVTITTGGEEQREPVMPGRSSLPQALQAYGAGSGVYSTGGETVGGSLPGGESGDGKLDPGSVKPFLSEGEMASKTGNMKDLLLPDGSVVPMSHEPLGLPDSEDAW